MLDLGDPAALPTSLLDVIEQPDCPMDALNQIDARFGCGKAGLGASRQGRVADAAGEPVAQLRNTVARNSGGEDWINF